MKLTSDEMEVLRLTAELFNAISRLPDKHPADMRETERDIHSIQNRVMARVAVRSHPEFLRGGDA